jgi:4-hydroxybenzoate polyprenyltransferase
MTSTASQDAVHRREAEDLPLVVDLDGTLIANDILVETASHLVSHRPTRAWDVLRWLRQGRAHAKRQLWDSAPIDVAGLSYHDEMLDWLRDERARGRTLVLASAADEQALVAVNRHLGLFDVVLGSDPGTNLRSRAKADALVGLYGEQGFEYVGNSTHDLDVWEHAAVAHVATRDRSIQEKAGRVAPVGRTFLPVRPAGNPWLRAVRPHQWVKNLLVLIPLFTAQRVTEVASVLEALLALVLFSLAASSVYVLNDLSDVGSDRLHPTKRHRPFAAGTLSLVQGWLAWPVMALLALGLGFGLLGPVFGLTLSAYLVTTTAYSAWIKRQPIGDVLTLAGLYTIRIAAGAAAIGVGVSLWLLSFSGFFFLSLALVKRVSELSRLRGTGAEVSGRGYETQDLELLSSYGVATSIASVLVFTLYIDDPRTAVLYASPILLWASVPVLLAWIMRVWLLAHRGQMDEDPIVFAIRDRTSLVCGALVGATFLLAASETVARLLG